MNYYRLKQWDYNGESHFSKTVSANIENISGGIYVYPNPVFNDIYMSGKISGEIIVSNYLGQIVFHKKMDGENRADISGLPEGIYGVVVLEERKRVYNGKIMKGGN
ncbi:MAG TPA: T9SS type A sorting domain-containing protein [Bacteroidetes bacterium]|nr:T9SS type A sorting domain-containing protein [Bacteroidota bacterium]